MRSGCKHKLSLTERFGCTETIINQLLGDSYKNPISECQMIIKLEAGDKVASELMNCIWQALSQNPTFILVCAWPSHYFIYHFHSCLFLSLDTCISHSFGKPTG